MQFSHVFHQVGLQLRINLTVSNAQMSSNELNKFRGMTPRVAQSAGTTPHEVEVTSSNSSSPLLCGHPKKK